MELLITVGVVISSTLLGLFIILKNPKSATNRIFALVNLLISLWSIVLYISLHPPSAASELFWIRSTMFVATPMTVLFLALILNFPHDKLSINRKLFVVLLSFTAITMAVALSPFMFTELKISDGNVQPVAGPGILLFVITVIGSIISSIIVLIRRTLRSQGNEKSQLRFILTGMALMFSLIIATIFIPSVFLGQSALVFLGPVYAFVFLSFVAYAIVRHKLLDIGSIVARAVAYTLIIGIVGVFYTLSTILVSNLFFRNLSTNEQIILFTTLTIIVAFTFQPLRRYLQKITDSFFYKGRYDSSELISKLTKIMATTLGLEDITKGLLTTLVPEIRVSKGAFVLIKKGRIDAVESYNYKTKPKFTGTDIDSLLEQEKILILEDLDNKKLKGLMNDLDLALAAPLKIGEETLGMLLLGHKLSGEIYTDQDIKLLQILSPEISIAIENAKAYEEIRKFNVTLQREIQKATVDLKFANEKLKELDRLKDEFVSVASHELRTPMTAIKSYSWLALEGKAGKVTPKTKSYLDKVYLSSERMIKLINDMLNVSRIESGKLKLDLQPTSVFKVAESVFSDLSVKAQEEKIALKIEKDQVVPQAFVDPDKLSEIFTNLVGNSIKFTPEHGTVTISAQKERDMLMISVSDTGTGISKENMSKLFSKFGRIEDSYVTSNTSMGTGLGLFIIKNYIEKMGGKIWVNSELGKGTTFTFSLPTTKTKKK